MTRSRSDALKGPQSGDSRTPGHSCSNTAEAVRAPRNGSQPAGANEAGEGPFSLATRDGRWNELEEIRDALCRSESGTEIKQCEGRLKVARLAAEWAEKEAATEQILKLEGALEAMKAQMSAAIGRLSAAIEPPSLEDVN